MNYHARMMNIPKGCSTESTYAAGHRDARHAAAEIAVEADAEIERLRAALEFYADQCDSPTGDGDGNCGYSGNTCCAAARAALKGAAS